MNLSTIRNNTIWNLIGAGLPIVVAIVAIPRLIAQLGDNRFGVLAIGWVIMAYFVLSDFGVGVATKKFLATQDGGLDGDDSQELVSTSMLLHAVLGLVGGAALFLASPYLLRSVFSVPAGLYEESRSAFYWLAASIPLLLLTSLFRNLLEAKQRFDLVNMVRVPASTINFLIPLVVLPMSNSIATMLAAIFAARIVVLIAHALFAIRVIPQLRRPVKISAHELRRLLGFGLWATVSSLIIPIGLIADRMFIASIFSLAAVTYYVTPYEMVTKLWIISASVLGALFPVFSALDHRSEGMARIVRIALVTLVVSSAPLVGLIVTFSRDILTVWIGLDMATQGGTVAKWIAVGVFFSIVAQLPLTVLQASGKPDAVAKTQIVQLPFFLLLAWWLSRIYGTVGVAMAWSIRNLTEAVLLYWIADRWTGGQMIFGQRRHLALLAVPMAFLMSCWLLESLWRHEALVRICGFAILLAAFIAVIHRTLTPEERDRLVASVRSKILRGSN